VPFPETEANLVELARAGDEAALSRLVDVYAPKILRFGQRLCGNAHDAEDVMQQTLLSVVSHIGEFRGDSHFASWLFAIARSHCIKQRTRGGAAHPNEPLEQAEASLALASCGAPDETVSRGQLERALDVAIQKLDPAQREVLLLRDVEGLSAPDVAIALSLSVDAVKSRLHRARKALRDQLSPWLEQNSPSPACPDVVDLLSRYQEGDVTSEACKTMEAHVDGCRECAQRCQSLRSVLAACSSTPIPTLSAELRLAVREQIRRSLKRQVG
jgi:RNA polymerase sigma-70 factor (ECF subfamily)